MPLTLTLEAQAKVKDPLSRRSLLAVSMPNKGFIISPGLRATTDTKYRLRTFRTSQPRSASHTDLGEAPLEFFASLAL